MTSHAHTQLNDDRFREPGIATPIVFFGMFIFFVYGALLVGLSGVSNWIVHTKQLTFFLSLGGWGILLLDFCFIAGWVAFVFICAAVPYYILRAMGRYIMASKVASVIIIAMFLIFAWPWIMGPMIRRGSPKMRQKYIAKLRTKVHGKRMRERLSERRARLIAKNYQF